MNVPIPRTLVIVVPMLIGLSTWASRAQAAEEEKIVPGRNIVTTVRAPVKVGDRVLLTLRKGAVLVAGRVEGDWILVTVQKDKKKIKGWVYAKHVVAKKPKVEDAMIYLVVGELDEAIAECNKLLERASKEVDLKDDDLDDNARDFIASVYNKSEKAEEDNTEGLRCPDQETLKPATDLFGNLVQVRPELVEPHVACGFCYWMQGKLDKAEADIEKAKQLAPHLAKAVLSTPNEPAGRAGK